MKKLFKIDGKLQNYAWGGKSFIPKLLGKQPSEEPVAEYWMGAHEKAPSVVLPDGIKLDELIHKAPEKFLGKKVASRFGRLPYLFKVLDVRDMLSIQVHPSKEAAEKGYQSENELGVALTSPQRNYKDDNHKPEIMVALSEFWLLHGFKSEQAIAQTLRQTPEFSHLIDIFDSEGYLGLYKTVMEEDVQKTNERLQPLIDRIIEAFKSNDLAKSEPEYWAAKAYESFCSVGNIDKGIYSIFFFNILCLAPGEGIFQDSGVPHAYLEGQNIELMANSDNVLRGGLTPKHVDVPELLKHVVFEETVPNVLVGDQSHDGFKSLYPCSAPDFDLSKISLSNDEKLTATSESLEIILVVEGEALAESEGEVLTLHQGEAMAITADCQYQLTTSKDVTIYMASAGV